MLVCAKKALAKKVVKPADFQDKVNPCYFPETRRGKSTRKVQGIILSCYSLGWKGAVGLQVSSKFLLSAQPCAGSNINGEFDDMAFALSPMFAETWVILTK